MQQHFRFFAVLALLTVLFATPGLALAHGEGPQQTVDGYTVTLALPEKGFFTGQNPLSVSLWDWQGNSPEATVSVLLLTYTPPSEGHSDTHSETAPDDHGAADDHGESAAADHGESAAADHGESAAADHGESAAADHGESAAADHGESAAADHAATQAEHSHDGASAVEGQGLAVAPVTLATSEELGEYRGELAFDEAGTYTLSVVFTVNGEERGAIFDVEVTQSRPRGLVLGGFALVNGLAITTAAFLKWRSPAKPDRKPARPASAAPSPEESSK